MVRENRLQQCRLRFPLTPDGAFDLSAALFDSQQRSRSAPYLLQVLSSVHHPILPLGRKRFVRFPLHDRTRPGSHGIGQIGLRPVSGITRPVDISFVRGQAGTDLSRLSTGLALRAPLPRLQQNDSEHQNGCGITFPCRNPRTLLPMQKFHSQSVCCRSA